MIDLHSHAFQRALAGLTQRLGADEASFWTWRDTMYAFAAEDHARRTAGDRGPALCRAAQGRLHVGGRVPLPAPSARRQAHTTSRQRCRWRSTRRRGNRDRTDPAAGRLHAGGGRRQPPCRGAAAVRTRPRGLGATGRRSGQGLRGQSEPPDRARACTRCAPCPSRRSPPLSRPRARPGPMPIHIHIAEQPKEVRDCLERFGRRPWSCCVEVAEIDQRWCLVHGTHLTDARVDPGRRAAGGGRPVSDHRG